MLWRVNTTTSRVGGLNVGQPDQEYITPQRVQRLIQLCIWSWSSVIGSSDVMRTLHTSARPVSRQGTVVFDQRVPATLRVPLRCVRYDDAKIRLRSTKTLRKAGSGVAHSGGLCTLAGPVPPGLVKTLWLLCMVC